MTMSNDAGGASASSAGLGAGALTLDSLDGYEVIPGVTLIAQPTPVVGTDKMRCLANVGGALGLVELRIRFTLPNKSGEHHAK